MTQRLPVSVLFPCSFNGVRSPMVAGLMKQMFGSRLFVESCGAQTKDADLDPFMLPVMDEIGIDLSGHNPKTFGNLEDDCFDVIVSLTPSAQLGAAALTRNSATILLFWLTSNPSLTEGRLDKILAAYRETRDALAAHMKAEFGAPSTFGA